MERKFGAGPDKPEGNSDNESENSDSEEEDPNKETKATQICKTLIAKGENDAALLIACYAGDVQALSCTLEADALVTAADTYGLNAGYFACVSGSLPTLQLLLEKDVHQEYTPAWFDSYITLDEMTPLMLALRHGLHGIYEFLVKRYGCRLKLVGPRFGVKESKGGLNAPVDRWLELLPEMTTKHQVSKRRPVSLGFKTINWDADVSKMSEAKFLEMKARRARARNWVRGLLRKEEEAVKAAQRHHIAELGGEADEEMFFNKKKRHALPVAENLPDAEKLTSGKPLYDVVASIAPQMHGGRGSKKRGVSELRGSILQQDTPMYWVCGKCNAVHRVLIYSNSQHIECHECHAVNLLRQTSCDIGARIEDEMSGEGSEWENEGKEFVDEHHVGKYLHYFKGSVLWLLGVHKLKELLRIVKVVHWNEHYNIFMEMHPIDKLCVLQRGEVCLLRNGFEVEKVIVNEGDVMQLLDIHSFIGENRQQGMQASTAVVHSTIATAFIFPKMDILNHCGFNSLDDMIKSALSMSMVSTLSEFKNALTMPEQEAVARILQFREYAESGPPLAERGQRMHELILVQKGKLRITEGDEEVGGVSTKVVHVAKERPILAFGHVWQKAFICGIRSLLYDTSFPVTIEVEEGHVQAWILSLQRADNELPSGLNMARLLQISTYMHHLRAVSLFAKLKSGDPRLRTIIVSLQPVNMWEQEDIICKGDEGDSLFVLIEGTVGIMTGSKENPKEVARLTADVDRSRVHYFGELAMLDPTQKRAATVRVKSTSAYVLQITTEIVEQAFGSVDELLASQGLNAQEMLEASKASLQKQPEKKPKTDEAGNPIPKKKSAPKADSAAQSAKASPRGGRPKAERDAGSAPRCPGETQFWFDKKPDRHAVAAKPGSKPKR